MTFSIPELSLVVLIGPSGCGKSTFARKHFKPTEVMSSDAFRALVSDDENDQSSTDDAFAALHFVVARRLARAKLTVVEPQTSNPKRASRSWLSRVSTTFSPSRSCWICLSDSATSAIVHDRIVTSVPTLSGT